MEGDFYHEDIHVPHNLQIEKLVLGSLLHNNSLYEEVLFLKENDFFDQFHQKLFKKAVSKINDGQLADKLTMVDFFEKNEIEISYLEEICNSFTDRLKPYAQTLRNIAKRRHVLRIGKDLMQSATEDTKVEEQIARAEKQIFEMQTESAEHNSKLIHMPQGMQEVLDNVIKLSHEGKKPGLSTGYWRLDELLGGLKKGELFILAGRPATGKTAFALNIAINASKRDKAKVLFISLEMSYEQICCRALSMLSKVSLSYIVHAKLSPQSITDCKRAAHVFKDLPLFIKDSSFVTIPALKTTIRQLKRTQGVDLVIIDYLQLIESHAGKYDNRETEISRISRGLKLLAKELDIPIIALSQLSRDIEKRKDTPRLSDLRGSGALEQDADQVGILYAPVEEDPTNIVLYLEKNRNGPVGEIYLVFDNRIVTFASGVAPKNSPDGSKPLINEEV
jgi:replicative DNA helicase